MRQDHCNHNSNPRADVHTRLPDSKKFRRDLSEERKSVFRSTIFPMDTALLKGSGIREFSEEISDIIRPQ